MKDFTFYNPGRIEIDKGKEEKTGQYISEYGIRKVLIQYGSDRIKKNGLFDIKAKSLTDKGISYEELGGIFSNPVQSKVYEGVKIAKAKGSEVIPAVEGGSVPDSSKAIGAGAVVNKDVPDNSIADGIPAKTIKQIELENS